MENLFVDKAFRNIIETQYFLNPDLSDFLCVNMKINLNFLAFFNTEKARNVPLYTQGPVFLCYDDIVVGILASAALALT